MVRSEEAVRSEEMVRSEAVAPYMAGPRVGIVMGSESDLPRMQECAAALGELGVPAEMRILSAHRVPEDAARYAREAAARGVQVLVAGAGLAAHLPGVLAAYTTLPVIGVPLAAGPLGGRDALYSIVQMPPGVPVATVAIDGARNAGILAAQMLALADSRLAERLLQLKQQMAEKVRRQDRALTGEPDVEAAGEEATKGD